MKGNADLDGRTGFFRGAQGPSGAVFGLESTFGVRSNSARSRSRSKEAIQTLHQAILCGRVVSGDVFHVGTHQNEPPRPVLAVGGTATISGDPDLFLEWKSLYHQFDGDPAKAGDHDTIQNFRRKALRELKKIKTAWPDLNYATARGVLILRPSKPAIIPHQQLQLVK